MGVGGQTIDEALSASSCRLGAASLVRCGLSLMEKGRLVTSGTIMSKATKAQLPTLAMRSCIKQHLTQLPESVKQVILLGTTDSYVDGVKKLMREAFPDYLDVNAVAFRSQGRVWVFAAHPSPANGTFKAWIEGDPSTRAGRKKVLALEALGIDVAAKSVQSTELAVQRSIVPIGEPAFCLERSKVARPSCVCHGECSHR